MRTPAERYKEDPVFYALVSTFYREFVRADASGAGLTPTEVREASSFAWQMYAERNVMPRIFLGEKDV